MTAFQSGPRYTALTAQDFTGKRYTAVKLDSNGNLVQATSATDPILGVIDTDITSGRPAEVVLLNSEGTFKIQTSAGITKDAYITIDTNGLGIAATTTGQRVIGRAVRTTVTGEVAEYIKSNEKY